MNENHAKLMPSPEWAAHIQEEVLPQATAGVELGTDLLELGPGPGAATDWLRHRVSRLVAVEHEEEAVTRLVERFEGTNVEAVSGDATALEYPDASFDTDVLKSSKPVLVDYWAEWCGPCKMIAPILDEVSKDYDGRLQIAKMNVDENRDVPAKFGIRGIPTLMLFKDGQLAATKVGALSKSQLTSFLEGFDTGKVD